MSITQIEHYEIQAEIGHGGMATVYQAYDARFEREVAIKVLPATLLHADKKFRIRFDLYSRTQICVAVCILMKDNAVLYHHYGGAGFSAGENILE